MADGPLFVVDGGDFAWKSPVVSPERLSQQRRKGQLQLDAFALVGMDGMVPGDGDLALGLDWLTEEVSRTGAPMLAANLECGGQAPFPPARTVAREGVTLGLVGLLGKALTVPEGCVVTDPRTSLVSALAGLQETDLVVLLSHQDPTEVEALLADVHDVDLVVSGGTGSAHADPRSLPGSALLLASGSRGKKLGKASITLVPGGSGFEAEAAREKLEDRQRRIERKRASAQKQREAAPAEGSDRSIERADKRIEFYDRELAELAAERAALQVEDAPLRHRLSHQLVGLTVAVADHPETAALLVAAKEEIETRRTTRPTVPVAPTAGPFVGSQVCAGCHPGPAAQWSQTPHAHAWTTLVAQKRSQDLDCFGCHATGAFHDAGPKHPDAVPVSLQGVGCEACHGPGRAHVQNPGEAALVANPADAVCTECHDGVQDEGRFEPVAYRAKVVHGPADGPGGQP